MCLGKRISTRKLLVVFFPIILISAGIVHHSSNLLLLVNGKKHHHLVRLEDLSSSLHIDTKARTNFYSVLEALIRDGYNPFGMSAVNPRSGVVRINRVNNASRLDTDALPSNRTLNRLTDDLIVPNVVHYVLTGPNKTFTFINYLSFLSVERFIKPEQIFVHGDEPPSGHWWNVSVNQVRNIFFVKRPYMDKAPNGQRYLFPAHSSDYARAEILARYGGIYLDPDVIVLKPFDPLRRYAAVLGRETPEGVCNGIMIAQKGAVFLRLMLEQYRSYKGSQEEWAAKSVFNIHALAQLYPHLVHIEETSLNRPNWQEKKVIYDGRYNWSGNYAMHLWIRVWPPEKRPSGPEDVQNKSTTLGEISRFVLHGSPELYNVTVEL